MNGEESEGRRLYTSEGVLETDKAQRVIGSQSEPGFVYIPEGEWEESIYIMQHNLTLIGEGPETVITGETGRPAITILAPHVRIVNLAVQTEDRVPAISFSNANATQSVIKEITVRESGGHGIYRDPDYASGVSAVLDCEFYNIQGHAISAEGGAGPKNIIHGNTGEDINQDFINCGVNRSLLMDNRCEDAPIRLNSNSRENTVIPHEDTELIDEGDDNIIL